MKQGVLNIPWQIGGRLQSLDVHRIARIAKCMPTSFPPLPCSFVRNLSRLSENRTDDRAGGFEVEVEVPMVSGELEGSGLEVAVDIAGACAAPRAHGASL